MAKSRLNCILITSALESVIWALVLFGRLYLGILDVHFSGDHVGDESGAVLLPLVLFGGGSC